MRVALFVGLNADGARGIALYQGYLTQRLAEIDEHNQYLVFGHFFRDFERRKREIVLPDRPNFEDHLHRWPESIVHPLVYGLDAPLYWPALAAAKVDVLHSTFLYAPWAPGIKTVTTVHDAMPELFPEWSYGGASRRYCRRWLNRAARVVAVSECTRRDIQRVWGYPAEKVQVIHQGVDNRLFRPAADPALVAQARARLGLPQRYLLSTGPFETRRDFPTAIRAFAEVARQDGQEDLHFVLVGRDGPEAEALRLLAKSLGLDRRLRITGHLPIADLVNVYQGAEAFLYCSLYEGFGHSPLEGLACGVPVVTSDASALPEVMGGAAGLAKPGDVAGYARELLAVMRDRALRNVRRAAGLRRAAELDWTENARAYHRVYDEVGSKR